MTFLGFQKRKNAKFPRDIFELHHRKFYLTAVAVSITMAKGRRLHFQSNQPVKSQLFYAY
jgi:hypothetical protein